MGPAVGAGARALTFATYVMTPHHAGAHGDVRHAGRGTRWSGTSLAGVAAAGLAALLVALSAAAATPDRAPGARGDTVEAMIRAQTDLGFRLLERLAADGDGAGNVVVAPPALGSVLFVLHAGASGETRRELGALLGLEPGHETEPALRSWGEALYALGSEGDPRRREMIAIQPEPEPAGAVGLTVGASLWLRAPREAAPDVESLLRAQLQADVETVELDSAEGRERIEAWIEAWTHGEAHRIPGPPTPMADALGLGSFFFTAGWQFPFPEGRTEPGPFHRADGSTVTRPFMRESESWGYADLDRARVVRLPYHEGRYAMYVALPEEGTRLGELLGALGPERWDGWTEEVEERRGEVRLPRIAASGDADLGAGLRSLGLERALEPGGEGYDRLLAGGREMGTVRLAQRAALEVDEEGTGAHAVAAAELREAAIGQEEPFGFRADRPFLAVIHDAETGAVLLAAAIRDPMPGGPAPEEDGG